MDPNLPAEEESMLVSLIEERKYMGFPQTKDFIQTTIADALDHSGKTNVFEKCNTPTEEWVEAFVKRHPTLIPIEKSIGKANTSAKEVATNWFENLESCLESQKLSPSEFLIKQNGQRIYVTSETRITIDKGVLQQTFENQDSSSASSSNSMVTAMTTSNALGNFVKPFLVISGTRPLKDFDDVDSLSFDVSRSKNGDMTHETFVDWILAFIEQIDACKVAKPVILFLDGHSHYVGKAACEIAREASVILSVLPGTVKPLNPFLENLSATYRDAYSSNLAKMGASNLKNYFPSIFMNAFKSCPNRKKCVSLGFQQTGLMPFDISKAGSSPPKSPNNLTASLSSSLPQANSLSPASEKGNFKNSATKVLVQKSVPKARVAPSPSVEVSPPSKKSKAQLVGEIRDFAYLHGFKDAIGLIVEKFVGEPVLAIYEESLHSKDDSIKDNIFLIWKCLNERLKEKTNALYNKRREEREKTSDIEIEKNCFVALQNNNNAFEMKKSGKRKNSETSRTSKRTKTEPEDTNFCQKCKKRSGRAVEWIGCDNCEGWFHKVCMGISTKLNDEQVRKMEWRCDQCE